MDRRLIRDCLQKCVDFAFEGVNMGLCRCYNFLKLAKVGREKVVQLGASVEEAVVSEVANAEGGVLAVLWPYLQPPVIINLKPG